MMLEIDNLVNSTSLPLPTQIQKWAELLHNEQDLRVHVDFERGTRLSEAAFSIHSIGRDDQEIFVDSFEWDRETDNWLIDRKIISATQSQEAVRFAIRIRSVFGKLSSFYGDGFFNSVLLHQLSESDLTTGNTRLKELTELISTIPVNPNAEPYRACSHEIVVAIQARGYELHQLLQYDAESSKSILTDALSIYLDDRFSVSIRQRMGLI